MISVRRLDGVTDSGSDSTGGDRRNQKSSLIYSLSGSQFTAVWPLSLFMNSSSKHHLRWYEGEGDTRMFNQSWNLGKPAKLINLPMYAASICPFAGLGTFLAQRRSAVNGVRKIP